MRSIQFSFAPGTTATEQSQRLKQVSALAGVAKVGQLDPASPAEAVRQMAFAYLRDDADASEVLRQVESLPGVRSASLPATRQLP
ncbi:MAG TPA: hypothetical protein VER17_06280 [Tepidisphaeraceae bacterium]|nr:hypothetical protein [Tepidisphaeraceae bacterium]